MRQEGKDFFRPILRIEVDFFVPFRPFSATKKTAKNSSVFPVPFMIQVFNPFSIFW
jgi:hypothetical protein